MNIRLLAAAGAIAALPALAIAQNPTAVQQAFLDVHHKMMSAMKPTSTGDADKDFAAMMIPHHQGAIDMAKIELQHGKDPKLRAMAAEIIKAQEKEIAELKDWQSKNK